MGERAHLGGPWIGVETHVADLIGVFEHEDLEQVVLCAHSYGGIPVTGAADRQPERVKLLVYIDALIPRDGESGFDLLPASFAPLARASAAAHGDGWRVSMPAELQPPVGCVSEDIRGRYVARLGGQPLATFADRVNLTGAVERIPRAFVRCIEGNLAQSAAAIRSLRWLRGRRPRAGSTAS